jgi:membrane carboxypeptidase/penicillin-binding protein
MVKAIRRSPPAPFTPPPGIVMTPVDATGRRVCGDEAAISEAFRQGSEPAACESIADAPVLRDVAGWIRGLFR